MNIYLENAAPYLFDLATSLERDPTSLDGWSCMLLPLALSNERTPPQLPQATIISILEHEVRNLEGSVIACPDDDILLICRCTDLSILNSLAQRIRGAISGYALPEEEQTIFDMRLDWRGVHGLLVDKAKGHISGELEERGLRRPVLLTSEVGNLIDVFSEARRHRQVRDPITILLVEDDAVTQRVAKNILKNEYVLHLASDGREAVQQYLMHAPDLVFLDINLPDANGLDVLDQLTGIDGDAYVVMFSGNDTLENIAASLSNGAQGFIAKPFRKERLRHYITDVEVTHQRQRGEHG